MEYEIGKVYITGAGYQNRPFVVGYDTIGWNETVWGGELTRSNKFTLENIDDVEIGQVPQCTIVFKYIKIQDFVVIQELLRERHITVTYYDIDYNTWVTHEMAITGNDRKKIYSYGRKILGVQDFTIKMVGTNNDVEYVDRTITYNANGGTGVEITKTFSIGDQMTTLTEEESNFSKTGYAIASWNTKADGSGKTYLLGQSVTVWKDLTLYAIWE